MNIVDHLFEGLKLAKADQKQTKDATLAGAIGALINQRFPGNEMKVKSILDNTPELVSSGDAAPVGMRVWNPGGKKTNVPASSTEESEVAVEAEGDDNDLTELAQKNPQELLDHFKTIPLMKAYAKEIGLDVNHVLEAEEFIENFQEALILISSDELEPEV